MHVTTMAAAQEAFKVDRFLFLNPSLLRLSLDADRGGVLCVMHWVL